MKKYSIGIALLLAAVMLFSACGSASNEKLVAKVEDHTISLTRFTGILDYYLYMSGIDTSDTSEDTLSSIASIKEQLLESLIMNEVVLIKAKELGLDKLTADEQKQVDTYVSDTMEQGKEQIETEVREANPDKSDSEINMLVATDLAKNGYIEEDLAEEQSESIIYEKVYDNYTKDITISEQELKDGYNEKVEAAKTAYADGTSSYEYDASDPSTSVYYVPDTARRVHEIVIGFSDEDSEAISNLQASGDTAGTDAKVQEALASIKSEAESVLSSIKGDGSNFTDIMSEKTDDPYYTDYPDGYYICKTNSAFPESVVQATFALEKAGAFSGLVASDDGYHIIYLDEEIAKGPVAYDTVKEDLKGTLLTDKQDETFYNLCKDWESKMKVTTYSDVLDTVYPAPSGEDATESASPDESAAASPSASAVG